jgi:S-adenosyl methyltransferase
VTDDGDWRTTFRPDIPSAARIYDYLLGGKDNYPADRAVAEAMIAQLPNVRRSVQWNRAFLRRVVRYLVTEAGIRQIIDIGAGLPTVGNTHEVALAADPGTRVVYIDHDPVVLAHARDMLHNVPNTAIVDRDLLKPEEILADPMLRRLIDFDEPTAFLFLSVLHFVSDQDDPAGLIADCWTGSRRAATWPSRTPPPTRCRGSMTWSGSSMRPPSGRTSAPGPPSWIWSPPWTWSRPA